MGDVSVLLVLIGAAIAFGAGMRWQHTRRASADRRLARTGARTTRKTHWVSLKATAVVVILLAAYLVGTLTVAINGQDDNAPRPGPSSSASPTGGN